jgi:hypothetical protein
MLQNVESEVSEWRCFFGRRDICLCCECSGTSLKLATNFLRNTGPGVLEHSLFNSSVSNADIILCQLYDKMITFGEREWIGEEAVVEYFEVLSQHFPRRSEKTHE